MIRHSATLFGLCLWGAASLPTATWAQLTIGQETVPAFEKLLSDREVVFEQLPPPPAGVGTLLINGTPVDPAFFPGVIRMTTGGTCTASIVGPSSILLAAHCVDHNSMIRFASAAGSVRGICENAPGFLAGEASEDWALCLLENPVGGLTYETINISTVPAIGTRIFLTGYGCTQQGGPLDGLLRFGVSTAADRPQVLPPETSTIYTASDITEGEAVLCPGDSGGPAFLIAGNDQSAARSIVGVNSRTTFAFGVSLLSATGSSAGKEFIEEWAERHQQSICGVNRDDGCR
jgi:hypothetical protein